MAYGGGGPEGSFTQQAWLVAGTGCWLWETVRKVHQVFHQLDLSNQMSAHPCTRMHTSSTQPQATTHPAHSPKLHVAFIQACVHKCGLQLILINPRLAGRPHGSVGSR